MKEKVSVKFCGQCNPRLRLRQAYDYIVDMDKTREYSFYSEDNPGDKVLMLCGCGSECAHVDFNGEVIKVHPEVGEDIHSFSQRALSMI